MESDVDAEAPAALPDRRRACRPPAARSTAPRSCCSGAKAGDHGRHRALLGPRRARAPRALRGAPDPGVPERAGARLRPGRSRAVLLARARGGAEGRRRGARDRGADGLPARASAAPSATRPRSWSPTPRRPSARIRARWPRSSTAASGATLDALRARAGGGADTSAWIAELQEVENEKRAGEQEELTDDRAPLHPLRVFGELQQVLDRDATVIVETRRLRLLRGPRDRRLRARLLDGSGPVRLPGRRPRLRAGGEAGTSRQAGLPGARRRRVRVRRDGVRHAGSPRRAGRGRDGQQRHLGAREAPDGVPLRLLGGGGAPGGLPLRRGRRAPWAATASWSSAPTSCGRRSSEPSPPASRRS